MKIRTVGIILGVVAVIGLAGAVGIRQLSSSVRTPVKVVSVSSVNMADYYDNEETTVSGNIVSKDTQNVELDNEYKLSKVYVKTGDTVKAGDPLIEYDMTSPELQLELHELQKQIYELNLKGQERTLEKLKTNPQSLFDTGDEADDLDGAAFGAEARLPDDSSGYASLEADTITLTASAEEITGTADGAADASSPAGSADTAALAGALTGEGETAGTGGTDTSGSGAEGNPSEEVLIDDGAEGGANGEELIDDASGDYDTGLDDLIAPDDIFADQEPIDPTLPDAIETQTEPVTEKSEEEIRIELEKMGYKYAIQLVSWYVEIFERDQYPEGRLNSGNISTVLDTFRIDLCDEPSEQTQTVASVTDAFGNNRKVKLYSLTLKDAVRQFIETGQFDDSLDDTSERDSKFMYLKGMTVDDLYIMYAKALFCDLVCKMNDIESTLTAAQLTAATADAAAVASIRSKLLAAVDAYYDFTENWHYIREQLRVDQVDLSQVTFGGKVFDDIVNEKLWAYAGKYSDQQPRLGDPEEGSLSVLISKLNDQEIVQETQAQTETETEIETEAESYPEEAGYDDGYDPDVQTGYTREEIDEMIRSQEQSIKETKLQIREMDIKLKQDRRILEGRVVKAAMDGIVKSAGSLEEGGDESSFIQIAGESGMYVQGSVNELTRDELKIGDVVTGMSWENYSSFTAKVTEISQYPSSGNESYGGYGENTNASYYPFLAYIEDSDGLVEGMAEMRFSRKSEGGGIYLDQYMVRVDDNGRSYVCVDDGTGHLKKQFVKTGSREYGTVEIKAGLSEDDLIAFPYGKNVYDGAQTVEAAELDGTDY